MQFLDTPFIFKPTDQAYKFIYALAENEVDLSIFRLSSVQIIIDRHKAFWRPFNIFGMGVPMTL